MPSAEPSSRDTSFTAEPTPCFARGSDVTIAVVDGVDVNAMPRPNDDEATEEVPVGRVAVELRHDAETRPEARRARLS